VFGDEVLPKLRIGEILHPPPLGCSDDELFAYFHTYIENNKSFDHRLPAGLYRLRCRLLAEHLCISGGLDGIEKGTTIAVDAAKGVVAQHKDRSELSQLTLDMHPRPLIIRVGEPVRIIAKTARSTLWLDGLC